VTVIGVTTDNEQQQAAYVEEMGLPYLLFSDERRIAVSQLGIPTTEVRGNVNAEPTAFAIGVDGTILDIVEQAAPKGLVARLLEAIFPPG
jgi:peroxiredoxin